MLLPQCSSVRIISANLSEVNCCKRRAYAGNFGLDAQTSRLAQRLQRSADVLGKKNRPVLDFRRGPDLAKVDAGIGRLRIARRHAPEGIFDDAGGCYTRRPAPETAFSALRRCGGNFRTVQLPDASTRLRQSGRRSADSSSEGFRSAGRRAAVLQELSYSPAARPFRRLQLHYQRFPGSTALNTGAAHSRPVYKKAVFYQSPLSESSGRRLL